MSKKDTAKTDRHRLAAAEGGEKRWRGLSTLG
jgi:hypothetical protein